ncbi:NitT/TauT family transport system permease protein [Variovorax paradoxus]|uniref:NitT/TauT family transport system permease protein n=2 Tax=Variovorax TaxID=34072 RepID=A0AAE4C0G3_VARPD|nr:MULTISPECIES: ABC transporter permease [Variovorax]MBD9668029.1 ABC transporter permease [Variovorax sp. VRV01]MDP9967698.1 NitT/TauT family transport system permease protein [Variovorax paradoxus]MDR6429167.1 NitT/TauT family transport system permease protein [Variovorax paradoxus]MDR6453954.1 NitT/TauT family transport system permease protein [Variovorax paradoxus]
MSLPMQRMLRSPVLAFVGLAVVWEIAVHAFAPSPRYLPALSAIAQDAWSVWPQLLRGFGRTLLETVLGFAMGAVFGCLCGTVFTYSRWMERSVFPLFVVSQTVPVVAFGALIVIWFGNSLLAKVMTAFFLTFFPVTVNTLRGLKSCDPQRIALMKSFGAGRFVMFFKLAVPSALPQIMVGLRVAIGLSLIGSVVGEWFGETVGLGVMLMEAMNADLVLRLWVVMFACGLMGALLYGALTFVERRLVWWRSES